MLPQNTKELIEELSKVDPRHVIFMTMPNPPRRDEKKEKKGN